MKKFNLQIISMLGCVLLSCLCTYTMVKDMLGDIKPTSTYTEEYRENQVTVNEEPVEESSVSIVDYVVPNVTAGVASLRFEEMEVSLVEEPMVISIEETIEDKLTQGCPCLIVLDSIYIKDLGSRDYETEELTLNLDELLTEYYTEDEIPKWDNKNRMSTLRVLWDFLVEQVGIPETNAAGILGNIYVEGTFGEEQTTYRLLNNIEDARAVLGKGKIGYGCVQWTYYERQENLLKYYELVNEQITDNWNAVKITAECCCMLEELKAFKVFDDIYQPVSVEDATGRVATKFERYNGYENDWVKTSEGYKVTSKKCAGGKRLSYAYNIYKYFSK